VSVDWSRELRAHASCVEIRSQPVIRASNEGERWDDDPSLRVYGESLGVTALQIRGRLATPKAPPAYAHAHLTDHDLVALYDALHARIKERGLGSNQLRQIRRDNQRDAEEEEKEEIRP